MEKKFCNQSVAPKAVVAGNVVVVLLQPFVTRNTTKALVVERLATGADEFCLVDALLTNYTLGVLREAMSKPRRLRIAGRRFQICFATTADFDSGVPADTMEEQYEIRRRKSCYDSI